VTTGFESAATPSDEATVAPRAQATNTLPRAPVRWPADVTALLSAALASVAVHTALKQHLTIDPAAMFGAAVVVFAGLIGLHVVLRVEPGAQSVTPKSAAKRRPKKTIPVDSPEFAHELHPTRQVHSYNQNEASANEPEAPGAQQHRAAIGFDRLQVLVAELARTTPGPKAQTPDPDGTKSSVSSTESTYTEALERSHSAQAGALANAARLMRDADTADSGLAAELVDALAADRMTVYLEPIQQMELDRPGHYEISIRFQSAKGVELPHEELLVAARHAGMLPRVDAAIVPRAARIAQHFQLRGRDTDILARVHGVSLPDHQFRAEVTAAAIAADGAAPVLSFAQGDIRRFGRIHWDILSNLTDIGVRFAIESVTDLDMDFEKLKRQGFAFVKLDQDVLLRGLPVPNGVVATADVCRHFGSLGLALIVNHIDDEAALARILGFGVLFGQGALFGGRRAVRADLLTSRRTAAA
jgi:EAL domain-containing protein (putative c-di-GMP-specific phosphodiesterase class I)